MTAIVPSVPATAPARTHLVRRLMRRPIALAAGIFLLLLLIVAVLAQWLAPYPANLASLQLVLAPPSSEHLLGADGAGRDVLSRLLVATQLSLAAALVTTIVGIVIGVTSGLIAGYYQGWFALVADWVTSLNIALPGIVVLLAARAAFGPSLGLTILILGVLMAPGYHRLVFTAVTAVRNELYVDAARVSGLSDARIIARHVLSVVRAPIIIQSAIVVGVATGIMAGLEFLGLGDMTIPSWGGMLNDGFANMYAAPLLILWPALAIALTCIALTLLGNAMRDELERTVVVRRRRRRAVTTATGSVTTATTSFSLSAADAPTDESEIDDHEHEVITHPEPIDARRRETLLRIDGLRVGYDQEDGSTLEVVHGVSMEIRKGEVHGLIGESGSGKSQTAFAVLGLLPRGGRVTGGAIDFDGVNLADGSERTYAGIRGRRISYIPQEPMSNLDPSFTIGSQLIEPLRVDQGMSKKAATERVLGLLDRVGIPDPKRTFAAYPFEVSGGMAQRVLIAGAVATEPDLIIADEPTTALDVTVQAEVLDLIRDLQRERHLAVLLVTHNFGVVADLCDRVTVMRNGLFIETGPIADVFAHPKHEYTQRLLGAILDNGPARPEYVPNGVVSSDGFDGGKEYPEGTRRDGSTT